MTGAYGTKSSLPPALGLSWEYVPLSWAVLRQAGGSLKPVTRCKPALNDMSCCLMPPLPAAAGGGPGHASIIRLDVRLSAKQPHVSHQRTVPDVTRLCFLPPPSVPRPTSAASEVRALVLVTSHLEVASLIQEVDLPLHEVHSQQ